MSRAVPKAVETRLMYTEWACGEGERLLRCTAAATLAEMLMPTRTASEAAAAVVTIDERVDARGAATSGEASLGPAADIRPLLYSCCAWRAGCQIGRPANKGSGAWRSEGRDLVT